MNPFVKTHIDQMNKLVNQLSRTLEEYERQLEEAQKAKEEQLKKCWSAERQMSALRETLDNMPGIDEENRELREKNQKSLEHAKRILEYSKALSGVIQE